MKPSLVGSFSAATTAPPGVALTLVPFGSVSVMSTLALQACLPEDCAKPAVIGTQIRNATVKNVFICELSPPNRGLVEGRRLVVQQSRGKKAKPQTGGVPWVWKDSIVFKPHAWPFLRSSSVQTIGFQSGARISRAPALATSTRLPPGSQT